MVTRLYYVGSVILSPDRLICTRVTSARVLKEKQEKNTIQGETLKRFTSKCRREFNLILPFNCLMVCQLPSIRNLFFVSRINTGDDRSLHSSPWELCVTSAERERWIDITTWIRRQANKKRQKWAGYTCRRHTHVDIASQRPRK
jgi:hypothetical protein